jgi:hypothetical protein
MDAKALLRRMDALIEDIDKRLTPEQHHAVIFYAPGQVDSPETVAAIAQAREQEGVQVLFILPEVTPQEGYTG